MARTRAKPANAKPMAKSAGARTRSVEPSAGTRSVEPSAGTANAKSVAGSTTITGTNSRLATASSKHSTAVYWRTTRNTAAICTISAMGTRSANTTATTVTTNARRLSTSTNATKTT